jgi:8-oxo-dGTP pyrophosphatase MutT (NUDIX family)
LSPQIYDNDFAECGFGQRLYDQVKQNLSQFVPTQCQNPEATRAAVALTIIEVSDRHDSMSGDYVPHAPTDAALILTLRSSRLNTHSGQWALPGGRIEKGETIIEAALRELREEVGLRLKPEHALGVLDDFETRSGFIISPVVFWGGADVTLTPDPVEVGAIHRIPIREFLRPDAPLLFDASDGVHPILMMPVGHTAIAAPTGAILYQFKEVAVLGKDTKVSHYGQPSFTWR